MSDQDLSQRNGVHESPRGKEVRLLMHFPWGHEYSFYYITQLPCQPWVLRHISVTFRSTDYHIEQKNEKSGNPQSHAIRYTQETPTEYNSKRPGTKRKAKAHKKPKKRKEDVAEDVAEVTWFLRT